MINDPRTDKPTERPTDGPTDRQTNRQTQRQTQPFRDVQVRTLKVEEDKKKIHKETKIKTDR